MDILDRILQLREERHWSEYQLAEKSGLTQSTISTWYRKNMLPSISSIEKICAAFDISLSQFFLDNGENTVTLSDEQINLLKATAKLEPDQFSKLLLFLQSL